jgi:hypothetical protein
MLIGAERPEAALCNLKAFARGALEQARRNVRSQTEKDASSQEN